MRAPVDLRGIVTTLLRWSPAQPLFSFINRDCLAVLAYHSVPDRGAFERHVDCLVARHRPVGLGDLIGALEGGSALPERAVLVTFDDGDKTIIENALPVLQARGVPAVLFVTVGSIDSQQPHWWDEAADLVSRGGHVEGWAESSPQDVIGRMKREPQQRRLTVLEDLRQSATGESTVVVRNLTGADLRALDAGGVAVENHTLTHPALDRCDDETIRSEITEAHTRLAGILGREPVAFAYPGGYCSEAARDVLAQMGYRVAFLFDHHLVRLPVADPLLVSRVRISADAAVARLAITLTGLHPAFLALLGRG